MLRFYSPAIGAVLVIVIDLAVLGWIFRGVCVIRRWCHRTDSFSLGSIVEEILSKSSNSEQFFQLPNVIGETSFHRRRHAQRLMDAAKVVPFEVQGHGSLEVVELLRKSIGKPGETTQMHPQTQIRPLDMRRADVLGIGPSIADFGYNLRDVSWGVAFIPVLPIVSVQLHKLREIHRAAEHVLDSPLVKVEAVRGHLKPARCKALLQAGEKCQRGFSGALANVPSFDVGSQKVDLQDAQRQR
jgi:hypothetical protein